MRRIFTIIVVIAAVAALAVGLMVYTGSLRLNHPTQPVHGVDVSHYQGEIDWPVLAGQNIQFAFVKATEGSIYTDETFEANWAGAQAAGLRVGAYHFFSYDSDGLSQAENYIATVPVLPGALPPVIDVEFYGDYFRETPEAEDVLPQLTAMVDALRDHYGVDPILYVTEQSYALYVAGGFPDCDIWVRSTFRKPKLSDRRAWTFWQYTDRAKLPGYEGSETFIDMNVFHGTQAAFDAYPGT